MEEKKAFNIVWVSLFVALIMWIIAAWNIVRLSTIAHYVVVALCTIWILISVIKIKKNMIPENKILYIMGRIMLVCILGDISFGWVSIIEFGFPYQYRIQKEYAEERGYEVSFFPESLP